MGEQWLLYSLYRLLSSHWDALTPVWLPNSADWWRHLQWWLAAGQVMMEEKEIGSEQDEENNSTTSRGPLFNPWPGCANTQNCTLYIKNATNKSIKKHKKILCRKIWRTFYLLFLFQNSKTLFFGVKQFL